ncbi:MAG: hypothetical protein ABIH82_01145 [Candidatus Woesearchaeota archaeon]
MPKKRSNVKKNKLKKELKHKVFWSVFVILFLISVIAIITQTENSITGNAALHTISFVKAGTIIDSEVNVGGINLANIYIKEDLSNSLITYEEDPSIPFNGIVYSKVKIYSKDANKLGRIDLTLKIKEQDLLNLGINRNELKLYINNNEASTVLTTIEGDYVQYTASINELGNIVIGKKKVEPVIGKTVAEPKVTAPIQEQPSPINEQQPESLPMQEPEPVSFWQKVANFFKGLFS